MFGVIPCLWDNGEATNGSQNGETFAMFRRKSSHDSDFNNWGQPIDHTILSALQSGNSAKTDANFGTRTIEAFIDAINGKTALGFPTMSPPATGPEN
jgi:hypothetical protein